MTVATNHITAFVLLVAGCSTTQIPVTDFSANSASDGARDSAEAAKQRRLYRSGDNLLIEIDRGTADRFISAVEPTVFLGELYLTTGGVSSTPRDSGKYEIDVGKMGLSPDWDRHVFWVVERRGSPFETGPLSAHTTRLKADVQVLPVRPAP